MKNKTIILILALLILLVFSGVVFPAQQSSNQATTKRFAMVVGANNGGPDRVQLKYAVSDAKSLLKVLKDMGGVTQDDCILLADPDRKTLFLEMKKLGEKINKARSQYRRVEVIFYYSGHSDEQNILLDREKVSYKDYRDAITGIDADVRIAVLDSCASGAFTRIKGGKKTSPFLIDTAYDMKGFAFMTSSSSDEASQESDRLRGSFFTHYLVSGLRGAADMTQDGRITLSEAYHFAFSETLAQTEKTMSGPQHPNYNIQMSGTGDVVMTDIRESSAQLVINKNISGKIFIHNRNQNDALVLELTKPFGRDIKLGLEQGKYRVINIRAERVYEAEIQLKETERFELNRDQFTKTDKIYTKARGDVRPHIQSKKEAFFKGRRGINLFLAMKNSTKVFSDEHGNETSFKIGFSLKIPLYFCIIQRRHEDEIAYQALELRYAFAPWRRYHLQAGLRMGVMEENDRYFQFFSPKIRLMMNLGRFFRVGFGISYPAFVSSSSGLNRRFLTEFCLEWGR
jgi:hypothetical protein